MRGPLSQPFGTLQLPFVCLRVCAMTFQVERMVHLQKRPFGNTSIMFLDCGNQNQGKHIIVVVVAFAHVFSACACVYVYAWKEKYLWTLARCTILLHLVRQILPLGESATCVIRVVFVLNLDVQDDSLSIRMMQNRELPFSCALIK